MKIFNQWFFRKPQTLGEGLARVKKQFSVVGADLMNKPGARLYETVSNDRVVINTTQNSLMVRKHLNLQNKDSYKNYLNKLAGLEKFYDNKIVDNKKTLNKLIFKRTFTTTYPKQSVLNKYYTDLYVSNYNKYFNKNISSKDVEMPTSTIVEIISNKRIF